MQVGDVNDPKGGSLEFVCRDGDGSYFDPVGFNEVAVAETGDADYRQCVDAKGGFAKEYIGTLAAGEFLEGKEKYQEQLQRVDASDCGKEDKSGYFFTGGHIVSLSLDNVRGGEVFGYFLARPDDQKLAVVPVAVQKPLHEGGVALEFVVVPAKKLGALPGVFLIFVRICKSPVDIGGPVVLFYPALLGFEQIFCVVRAVFLLVLFEQLFIKFSARLAAAFYPSGTVPIDASVALEVFGVLVFRAEQERNAVMATRNDYGNLGRQTYDAVAAQAITEEGGVILPALNIARTVEGLPDLGTELIRLVVQALRHQDDVNGVLRAGRAQIGLSLHYLTDYKLESHW
jgi:hypothetical protein